MVLNNFGDIAEKFWLEIPNHFPNVILDEFVIMPNHVHGIMILTNNDNNVETPKLGISTKLGVSTVL